MGPPTISKPARSRIAWLGEPPADPIRKLLEALRLQVDSLPNGSQLADDGFLEGVAAVVFAPRPDKPIALIADIETYSARLLDHDCRLFVFLPEGAIQSAKKVFTRLRIPCLWPAAVGYEVFDGLNVTKHVEDPPLPHARLYRGPISGEELARLLLSGPAGPAPASARPELFEIRGPAESLLNTGERMMLRRAFFDCEGVFVRDFDEGKSGARVLHAHATLRREHAGIPVPFFVKIGTRRDIITEWTNYETDVRDNTPFHLAPRLLPQRCALGAECGILVGDLVEDSESLIDCARSGRATIPIAALFERTLRGWHHLERTERRLLSQELNDLLSPNLPNDRLSRATTIGATLTEEELRAKLKRKKKEEVAWGLIHGDLNAANVRVRGNDAILIDFLSTKSGLLLFDHATLEASLLVRAPDNDGFEVSQWRRVVEPLFEQAALVTVPAVCDPSEPYAWLVSYIRQIRIRALALEKETGQYARVLAHRLYNAATKESSHAEEESRRTFAYVLAERLAKMTWKTG